MFHISTLFDQDFFLPTQLEVDSDSFWTKTHVYIIDILDINILSARKNILSIFQASRILVWIFQVLVPHYKFYYTPIMLIHHQVHPTVHIENSHEL